MRIGGVNPGGAAFPAGIAGIFDRLNIGDVVRARVIDILTNEILMKMFDGTTFTAVTVSDVRNITKGDFVEFIVTGKADGQLLVELLNVKKDHTSDKDSELVKLLESMGFKPDKTEIEIVKNLKSHEIPVQKETIKKIYNALKNYSELDIDKAVFLLSSNMEIEKNNISSLDKFINEKFKIGNALKELLELLEEVPDDVFLKGVADDLELFDNVQSSGNIDFEAFLEIRKGNSANKQENEQANVQSDRQVSADEGNKQSAVLGEINGETVEVEQDETISAAAVKHFTGNKAVKTETEREVERQLINISTNENDGINDGRIDENKKASFFRKLFEKHFIRVDSETLSDDLSITKNYKEIYRLLKVIRNNLEFQDSHQYRDRISRMIDNIESGIRFLNELNNCHTYIHIPLKMWNENTTAELYVFKKKSGKKKINPEDSVVYISLDTINIGRVDTLISLKMKNISLNFAIEREEIMSYFKDNYISLYNRLLDKGYKLVNVSYTQMKDDVNITNVHKKIREIFGDKDKCTVDIRI